MYYVYILNCAGNTLYTGITTDVERRFAEHTNGTGAKYTRSHKPVSIAGLWEAPDRAAASKLEAFIKKQPKTKKEEFIKNPSIIYEIFKED